MSDVLVMEILADEKPLESTIDFNGEYLSGATGEEYQKGYNEGYEVGKKESYNDGYNVGYSNGSKDGKQAEYDAFWDNFQHNGELSQYAMAFGGLSNVVNCWNNNNWKPKYDFLLAGNNNQMFMASNIEGDMVECLDEWGITFNTRECSQINQMFKGSLFTRLGELDFTKMVRQTWAFSEVFMNMANLVTIDKIKSDTPISGFSKLFDNCTALKNITFDCIIEGASISFLWSPLSVESMKNIILHLQNYAGTNKEFLYTVSFNSTCWDALEADSSAPDGGTWQEYVFKLGWNA